MLEKKGIVTLAEVLLAIKKTKEAEQRSQVDPAD